MIKSCNTLSNNKIITVKEKKSSFTIENSSSKDINKVEVDGCLNQSTSNKKCDFLFEVLNNSIIEEVLYIELKGKDIANAIKQLEQTIQFCNSQYNHNTLKQECYIVASRVPSSGTSSQNIKKAFKRNNKIILHIDTIQKRIKI
jgi:hypothetical protein